MWYAFDFSSGSTDQAKQDLAEYVTRVAKTCDNHASILVNNLAMKHENFKKLSPNEISELTRVRIDNHSFITDLLMI